MFAKPAFKLPSRKRITPNKKQKLIVVKRGKLFLKGISVKNQVHSLKKLKRSKVLAQIKRKAYPRQKVIQKNR